MANTFVIKTAFRAVDQMSGTVKKMQKNVHSFGAQTQKSFKKSFNTHNLKQAQQGMQNLSKKSAIGFTAGAAGITAIVRQFGKLEQGMSNVSTLVDTSTVDMGKMQKEFLSTFRKMPIEMNSGLTSLYDIISATGDAKNAMGTLNNSAKLSVAGLSTISEATDVMTSAMNTFSNEGLSSAEIANIFFKTVKQGKTTVAALAEAFGASAPIMESVGVKFRDFQAATAAMTLSGMPASQAQNFLATTAGKLLKPTKELQMIYEKLNVSGGKQLIANSKNFGEALSKITKTSEKYNINLAKALGSKQAMTNAYLLTTKVGKQYNATLDLMKSKQDLLSEAFKKQQKTVNNTMATLRNRSLALVMAIGEKLAPAIMKLSKILGKVLGFMEKHPGLSNIIANVVLFGTVILGTIMVLGFLGQKMISTYRTFYDAIGYVKKLTITKRIYAKVTKSATFSMRGMAKSLKGLALSFGPLLIVAMAGAAAIYLVWRQVKKLNEVTEMLKDQSNFDAQLTREEKAARSQVKVLADLKRRRKDLLISAAEKQGVKLGQEKLSPEQKAKLEKLNRRIAFAEKRKNEVMTAAKEKNVVPMSTNSNTIKEYKKIESTTKQQTEIEFTNLPPGSVKRMSRMGTKLLIPLGAAE